jgi:tetratricopeptide (TPR) repeat protein
VGKQQRVKPRAVSKPLRSPVATTGAAAAPAIPVRPLQPSPSSQQPAQARTRYADAIALYEQGVSALHVHEYSKASTLLRSVLSGYPEEKELHERARLYLNVCERQVESRAAVLKSPEELIFAATVAFNAANYDEALSHLRTATAEAPDHDHALYMLAAVLTLRQELNEAVPVLLRAIELNPENRAMARHDPDLAALRAHDQVRAALHPAPAARNEPRKSGGRRH